MLDGGVAEAKKMGRCLRNIGVVVHANHDGNSFLVELVQNGKQSASRLDVEPTLLAETASVSRAGFAAALRSELAGTGITVTLVVLGTVETPYWRHNPGSRAHVPKANATLMPSHLPRALREETELLKRRAACDMRSLNRELQITAKFIKDDF